MPSINQVALSGYLTTEPDLSYNDRGVLILTMRMVTRRSYRDKDNVTQDECSHFTLTLRGAATESFSRRLHRKSHIFVTGHLYASGQLPDGTIPIEIVVRNLQITDGEIETNVEQEAVLHG